MGRNNRYCSKNRAYNQCNTGPKDRRQTESVPTEANRCNAEVGKAGSDDPAKIQIECSIDRNVGNTGPVCFADYRSEKSKRNQKYKNEDGREPDDVKVPCKNPSYVEGAAEYEEWCDFAKTLRSFFSMADEAPLIKKEQRQHEVNEPPDAESKRGRCEQTRVFFGNGAGSSDADWKQISKYIDEYRQK